MNDFPAKNISERARLWSKYCAFGALAALLIALATATGIEKFFGKETVSTAVYGAWWFVALWAVFGISAFVYLFSQAIHRNKPALVLHCAFGLILLGAFITFVSAERGYLHLYQGETLSSYVSDEDSTEHLLPFEVKLVLFDIEYHPGTDVPADFFSFLKVDGEICQVSMNKIYIHQGYRFYQMDYDQNEMGTVLMVNHDPWGIGVTYTGYLLLAIAMFWLLFLRLKWKGVLLLVVPVAALWFYISQINPMTPVLRTPMLAAHVSVIMVSYLLIIFITVTSIIALCSPRRSDSFYRRNSQLLYPAVFLLAMGIFIGAVWANISWGRYWGWDAKETWALITLLIYALPFHKRTFPLFADPIKFHRYCAIASLAVAMTFFGVTYLLGGMHSYVG